MQEHLEEFHLCRGRQDEDATVCDDDDDDDDDGDDGDDVDGYDNDGDHTGHSHEQLGSDHSCGSAQGVLCRDGVKLDHC